MSCITLILDERGKRYSKKIFCARGYIARGNSHKMMFMIKIRLKLYYLGNDYTIILS